LIAGVVEGECTLQIVVLMLFIVFPLSCAAGQWVSPAMCSIFLEGGGGGEDIWKSVWVTELKESVTYTV